MRSNVTILVLFLVFCLSSPAIGEYYQYTAPDGSVRFTDDMTKIPEDQRSDLTKHDSVQPSFEYIEPVDTSDNPEGTDGVTAENVTSTKEHQARQEELDNQYKALTEEQKKLDEELKKIKTEEDRSAYIKHKDEFNKKAQAYKDNAAVLSADIETHNAIVRDQLDKSKASEGGGDDAGAEDDFIDSEEDAADTEETEVEEVEALEPVDE